jgi:hypothetical protein
MNVTINNKLVNMNSLEFADVFKWDAPDFCDAYVESAEFEDGNELSEEDLDVLEEKYYYEVRDTLYTNISNYL